MSDKAMIMATTTAEALEAIDVASAGARRMMRVRGFDETAIEAAAKRHRRLAARLRAGRELREQDVLLLNAAMAARAVLWQLMNNGPATPRATRSLPEAWRIGDRLVEIATGATWWVDEHHLTHADLVGVIPDVGAPMLVWIPKEAFARVGGGG
jgi:hypothetical protein